MALPVRTAVAGNLRRETSGTMFFIMPIVASLVMCRAFRRPELPGDWNFAECFRGLSLRSGYDGRCRIPFQTIS